MALPLLGLWLLIAQPMFDVRWEDHQVHLWLVAAVAAISLGLSIRINEQARGRSDARLFLVSLAFIAVSGFLGLHALATPGVLLQSGGNLAFTMAAPIGLFLASGLALTSSVEFTPAGAQRVVRWQMPARVTLAAVLVGATVVTMNPPFATGPSMTPTEGHGSLVGVAVAGSLLYGVAALRYFLIHRRRPAPILLSIITAFVLLAETLVAMVYARNWQASWWEWHILMLVAVGFVAYSARVLYQREGSRSGLFNSVSLEWTLEEVRREHTAALEALVDAMSDTTGRVSVGRVTARLADQFGITERQTEVLEQAATALARERDQARRLEALVGVGLLVRVNHAEQDLLGGVTDLVHGAFGDDRVHIRMVRAGRLEPPADTDLAGLSERVLSSGEPAESDGRDALLLPLTIKERTAGVLEVRRPDRRFSDHDQSVLRLLASQVSIALENARLYQHLDGLFRSYMSPDVARALLADPAQAALGGAVAEVTVLMADLVGFTPYSERAETPEVVSMLNAYFGRVVPSILGQGGTVTQFIGDAVMALFNAPVRQPDHALRAARAGLELQRATAAIAGPGWPRFRVGINTGPALVGNIGSEAIRHFTAIGDTVNLAARLESAAPAGEVVISASTRTLVADQARVERVGAIKVKGKAEPVEAYVLRGIGVDGSGGDHA
jgi:class 3 adenylate cyclase